MIQVLKLLLMGFQHLNFPHLEALQFEILVFNAFHIFFLWLFHLISGVVLPNVAVLGPHGESGRDQSHTAWLRY